jgi:putative ABC transport system permease protein
MSILKNYLISLSRNFVRDLFYSLINLTGLAIGLTSAFLIFIYLQDELTYDRHFEKHERIYRLESHFTINSKEDKFAITQVPLAPTMKDEFPEIEEMARLIGTGQTIFLKGDQKFE